MPIETQILKILAFVLIAIAGYFIFGEFFGHRTQKS